MISRLPAARRYRERAQDLLSLPRPFPAAPAGSGLKTVPGETGPPLVGSTLGFLRDPWAVAESRYAKFGPVSWGNMFGTRFVTVIGPDGCEAVLSNRDKAFAMTRS